MEGLQRRGRETRFSGLLTGLAFPLQGPGTLPRAFSGSETVSTTQSIPTPQTIPRTQGTSTATRSAFRWDGSEGTQPPPEGPRGPSPRAHGHRAGSLLFPHGASAACSASPGSPPR